jgi:hypothetical protein
MVMKRGAAGRTPNGSRSPRATGPREVPRHCSFYVSTLRFRLQRERRVRHSFRRLLQRHCESWGLGADTQQSECPQGSGFTVNNGSPGSACAFAAAIYQVVQEAYQAGQVPGAHHHAVLHSHMPRRREQRNHHRSAHRTLMLQLGPGAVHGHPTAVGQLIASDSARG